MTSLAPRAPVRSEPMEQTIHRLETFVSRMERRYECASDVMYAEIKAGRIRETAEVSRWLGEYRVLGELRQFTENGPETGSTSKTTRTSTTDVCARSTKKGSSKKTT